MSKRLLALIFITSSFSAHSATQAQLDSMRAKSLAYLITQQKGDGSWRDEQGNGVQATAMALEALSKAGITTGYSSGAAVSWLLNAEALSTDSLARQIVALSKQAVPVDDLVNQLLAARSQRDGGWGAYKGYQSSMPDTALGYDALLAANLNVASDSQLANITNLQGQDGGWAYFKDTATTKSALVPTAYGVLVLSHYAKYRSTAATAMSPNITSAINWLLTKKKYDGGYAEDLDSTGNNNPAKTGKTFETGLVKAALLAAKDAGIAVANTTQATQALTAMDDFLVSKQLNDGSWEGQVLQTANATQASPSVVLVDTDRDGVPDSVETYLNHNVNLADGRDLPKGNGDPSNPNAPANSGEVPLPIWAYAVLVGVLFWVMRKHKRNTNNLYTQHSN